VQAPSAFSVLTPCRLFDTRNATGPDAASPILAAGEIRTLSAASKCSLPAGAKVLSVNETVTGQTVDGGLLLFRGDLTWTPTASSLSFRPGITRSNNGIVEVTGDGTGSFKVFNNSTGAVHFILDVNGYFQ